MNNKIIEILIKAKRLLFKKIYLKMSSAQWWHFDSTWLTDACPTPFTANSGRGSLKVVYSTFVPYVTYGCVLLNGQFHTYFINQHLQHFMWYCHDMTSHKPAWYVDLFVHNCYISISTHIFWTSVPLPTTKPSLWSIYEAGFTRTNVKKAIWHFIALLGPYK